jgi:hypothetical protein
MTAENSKFKIIIVLGRKLSTAVTLQLHELIESRLVCLHYVPHELLHSAKSHPSVKSQNSASAKYEEYCRLITIWIIQENPHVENLSLEEAECPMTGRLIGYNEQRLLCQSKTQVVEKQIHTENKQYRHTQARKPQQKQLISKRYFPHVKVGCIFMKAYQQGST